MADKVWGKFDGDRLEEIIEKGIPIVEKMGVKVLEMAPGRVSLRMPLSGNENHIGIMYAGVLSVMAEMPGGALFLTTFDASRYVPIVKGMDIRFKRPATTDVFVIMEMDQDETERIQKELEEQGKSDFVLAAEIKDANGQVVAVSRTDCQIRSMELSL